MPRRRDEKNQDRLFNNLPEPLAVWVNLSMVTSPSDTSQGSSLPRILLVEDSQTTTVLVSKYLSSNYQLLHAKDGEQAWDVLQANPDIELVITDIVMPRLTGHQLLVKIRKHDDRRFAVLPVIVMTTADDSVDRNLAFLNGANDFITKPIDEMELQARVHVHHKLARTIRELETSHQALAELATTDPLTKLKNRRAFFENGEQSLALTRRYKTDLSIIVADVDHFKKINDSHGHQVGDNALIAMAGILTRMTRSEDTVARIGGEEFALILSDTNRLGAAVLAERIRVAVEKERIVIAGKPVPLTISMGVACYTVEHVDSLNQLLSIADRRLYLAKKRGRNRICVNDDGDSSFAS